MTSSPSLDITLFAKIQKEFLLLFCMPNILTGGWYGSCSWNYWNSFKHLTNAHFQFDPRRRNTFLFMIESLLHLSWSNKTMFSASDTKNMKERKAENVRSTAIEEFFLVFFSSFHRCYKYYSKWLVLLCFWNDCIAFRFNCNIKSFLDSFTHKCNK